MLTPKLPKPNPPFITATGLGDSGLCDALQLKLVEQSAPTLLGYFDPRELGANRLAHHRQKVGFHSPAEDYLDLPLDLMSC
jgi:hypothetical protein